MGKKLSDDVAAVHGRPVPEHDYPAGDFAPQVLSKDHHHCRAGADPRSKNQVSPGLQHVRGPDLAYAVFNHRQFWDGHAENVFNGVNHLGPRDPDATVFRADAPKNPLEVRVELAHSEGVFGPNP